jgi:hypothetical protein
VEGYGPCERISFFFHFIGFVLMLTALICDTLYCIKQVFATKTYFAITVGILGTRILICFALFLSYLSNRVLSQKVDLEKEGVDTSGLSVH